MVFAAKGQPGRVLLAGWLAWARRCRISEFVKLAATIKRYLPLITNTLVHGMSRSETTNTHLLTLTRRAYGSTARRHSSPWPRSPAAASAHRFHDETTHENDRTHSSHRLQGLSDRMCLTEEQATIVPQAIEATVLEPSAAYLTSPNGGCLVVA